MDLQDLIDQGEKLRKEPYDSPDVGMWENDVKGVVAKYGDPTTQVLQQALRFGYVITSDSDAQQMHNKMISDVQKLLTNLQKRNPEITKAESAIITQKKEEAKASLGAKFGNMTINGPVTFGNNSPANSIQVSELMTALISQAEQTLPDGPDKKKILESLKGVLANPTFAAMAGASLPEILKHLLS